jgi:hypothetical protein
VRVEGSSLSVEAIGGRRIYEFEGSKPLIVIPLSGTAFYVDGRYHMRIAFMKDSAGKVSGAILNPGRWEQQRDKDRLAWGEEARTGTPFPPQLPACDLWHALTSCAGCAC